MLPVRASVVESMRLSILLVLAAMVGVAVVLVLVLVLSRGTVLHHSTALCPRGSWQGTMDELSSRAPSTGSDLRRTQATYHT